MSVPADFNPGPVLARHWRSVGGARLFCFVIGLVAGLVVFKWRPTISTEFAGAASGAIAIVTTYFLYVMAQANTYVADQAARHPEPTERLRVALDRRLNVISNGFAGMVLALLSIVLVGAAAGSGSVWVAAGAAIAGTQLMLTLLLVATRNYFYSVREVDQMMSAPRRDEQKALVLDL